MRQIPAFLRQNLNHIIRTGIVFLATFGVYAQMAGDFLKEQSIAPHYVYLAQAFLQRQTNLIEPVISSYDLLRYHDKLYVAHQPLPALLIMPFLKVVTPINFPDVLFTVLLGALSVALCDLTLAVMVPTLSPLRRALMTVFFALGTMHAYMSALGTVWFTAQIAATMFLWVFLLGMAWRLPWLAGIGLGAALLGRASPIPGALVLYLGWLYLDLDSTLPLRAKIRKLIFPLIQFGIPFGACLLVLGWYNAVRFDSPFDFGYEHIIDIDDIAQRRIEHGTFSPVFLDENLYTATIRPPLIHNGKLEPDPWGMGLLLTSPVLLYTFAVKYDRRRVLMAGAVVLMLVPALLYHNTGSVQFGYRFVLDALPVWIILAGIGAQHGKWWLLAGLTVYAVVVNFLGFTWMYEIITSQSWHGF